MRNRIGLVALVLAFGCGNESSSPKDAKDASSDVRSVDGRGGSDSSAPDLPGRADAADVHLGVDMAVLPADAADASTAPDSASLIDASNPSGPDAIQIRPDARDVGQEGAPIRVDTAPVPDAATDGTVVIPPDATQVDLAIDSPAPDAPADTSGPILPPDSAAPADTALPDAAAADAQVGDAAVVTGALRVPFVVTDRIGRARTSEPLTFGMPIPLSANILSTSTLGVLDDAGTLVPAQFRVTGRWNGAATDSTRPIRWVLIDFQPTLAANGTRTYSLALNRASTASTGIQVTDSSARIAVDTGAATFWISKNSFNLFDRVAIGGTVVVGEGSSSGAVVRAGTSSYPATVTSAVLEEQGPMRVVLRLQGRHGSHADFTCRMHFFHNKPFVKVQYRLENNRQSPISGEGQPTAVHDLGATNSIDVEDLTLGLRLAGTGPFHYAAEGGQTPRTGNLGDALVLYQESSGLDSWNAHVPGAGDEPRPRPSAQVTFRGYRMTLGTSSLEAGNQALGWTAIDDGQKGIMVGARDFWQQYPKAARARSNGDIELGLLPTEFPAAFNFRVGEYKTHESYFHFFTGPGTASALSDTARALNEPLMARPSARYVVATRAVQEFAEPLDTVPSADAQDGNYERSLRSLYDDSVGANASWVGDYLSTSLTRALDRGGMYSYLDFGDLPLDFETARGQYGLKYNAGYGFLLQFLRTGNYNFWEWGENGERHEGDIDIVHTGRGNLTYYWDGAFYGHSYHDENGDQNPHRNYGGGNPDLVFGVAGLLLYHQLTGYEWAREYAMEVADSTLWKLQGGCCLDADNIRGVSNTVRVLLEAYRATGEARFGTALQSLITSTLANNAFFATGAVSFATFDFLRNVGFSIDYLELVTGSPATSMRQSLLARIATCRDNPYPGASDDGANYAINFQDSDWSLSVADVLAYAYKLGGAASDLALAGRLFNTGLLGLGIGVGCDPDVWGATMLMRPTPEKCAVLHYMQSKETVNQVLNGSVYMARKHPADSTGVIIQDR